MSISANNTNNDYNQFISNELPEFKNIGTSVSQRTSDTCLESFLGKIGGISCNDPKIQRIRQEGYNNYKAYTKCKTQRDGLHNELLKKDQELQSASKQLKALQQQYEGSQINQMQLQYAKEDHQTEMSSHDRTREELSQVKHRNILGKQALNKLKSQIKTLQTTIGQLKESLVQKDSEFQNQEKTFLNYREDFDKQYAALEKVDQQARQEFETVLRDEFKEESTVHKRQHDEALASHKANLKEQVKQKIEKQQAKKQNRLSFKKFESINEFSPSEKKRLEQKKLDENIRQGMKDLNINKDQTKEQDRDLRFLSLASSSLAQLLPIDDPIDRDFFISSSPLLDSLSTTPARLNHLPPQELLYAPEKGPRKTQIMGRTKPQTNLNTHTQQPQLRKKPKK